MRKILALLILILGFSATAHSQGVIIRYQNSTTTLGQVAGGTTTIKCDGTSVVCTFTGGVFTITSTGGGGAVSSVFGRTGAVVAATNDYNFSQLAGTVALGTQASGQLPIANVGSSGLSGTSPITISSAGAIGCATCNVSAATVTSVGFTGGLISVANPTTTPAFTVAGTSGGIPYFSGAATWASSGALTQFGVLFGGGAGGSPTSSAQGGSNFPLIGQGASNPVFSTIAYPTSLTSGGFLYASSTTAFAGSALLATNTLPKSGGAGSAPVASSVIDNGTAVTSTDAGGYVAPVFVANGTTAGFMDFPQGSTSSAVAPCNVATSICEQAPTSVTSYLVTKPGTGPAVNNMEKSYTALSSSATTESFVNRSQSVALTGTYTNATTGFTNVTATTNLAFTLDASTTYSGYCSLYYSASAVTAGPKIEFTGPASPTSVLYGSQFQLTATPTYLEPAGATAYSTSLTASTAVTATTVLHVRIDFGIVNGTNAGTLQLLAAANGSGTVTIEPGSSCRMQGN